MTRGDQNNRMKSAPVPDFPPSFPPIHFGIEHAGTCRPCRWKPPPDWWEFELELSPHVLDRMIERDFSEADLRLMMEVANGLRSSESIGRWNVETSRLGDQWEIVVEPDVLDRVIVVITAYKATAW
jgi:hypothetical protein